MRHDSKETILSRLNAALENAPSDPPAIGDPSHRPRSPRPGPACREALRLRFLNEFESVQGQLISCRDARSAAAAVVQLVSDRKWSGLAWDGGGCVREVAEMLSSMIPERCRFWNCDAEHLPVHLDDLADCPAALTGCSWMVAETGSLFLTPDTAGARALSVLPPVHLVVASWAQLQPDLETLFQGLERQARHHPEGLPAWMSLATGPSRTADIEKHLVLGAHGPRELILLAVEEDETGVGS